MENLKFILTSIILVVLVVAGAYWAIFTIEPGSVHADKQKQEELEEKNLALEEEVKNLRNELAALQTEKEAAVATETPAPTTTTTAPTTTTTSGTTTTYKHQALINELQKLVNDKVYMKEKSRGTRVGTVQNFLNLYFKTSKKVDNDYGAGTKADVIKFQKAVGITADGETGPTTYLKMIEWLKKQG